MIHIEKRRTIHTFFNILKFGNHRWSKLAKLHRTKERKPPSLSNQARFAPFTLKVAWSGISLIVAPESTILKYMTGLEVGGGQGAVNITLV